MDPFIGEIRLFAGVYAPKDWAFCDGSLMLIREYRWLFSLLGTTYGGDGVTNFALPDLRGRAPMHFGEGPGLSARQIGQPGGSVTVALKPEEMPAHTHTAKGIAGRSTEMNPIGGVWANSTGGRIPPNIYADVSDTPMNPQAVGVTGGNSPHTNMQPYLGLHYIIAFNGQYPQQP